MKAPEIAIESKGNEIFVQIPAENLMRFLRVGTDDIFVDLLLPSDSESIEGFLRESKNGLVKVVGEESIDRALDCVQQSLFMAEAFEVVRWLSRLIN